MQKQIFVRNIFTGYDFNDNNSTDEEKEYVTNNIYIHKKS